MSPHYRFVGMIGNILGNYDKALFGLLAPFLAPLFFEGDPITALVLTYGMLPLGILTRPLGSLFFGRLGDRYGRKYTLACTLLGMALTTVGIGCLPTYREMGIWAPLMLAFARMVQGFFAAGESTGAALFVLENSPVTQRTFLSSLFGSSSILGYLMASSFVTLLCLYGQVEKGWRLLFWLGAVAAFVGVYLRLKIPNLLLNLPKYGSVVAILKEHKRALISIILASGFSYTTYAIPFTLMNGYVPLVTSISQSDVMHVNTGLLVIDMLLLPLFGYLASKFDKEKIMLVGALGAALSSIPLFSILEGASLGTVIAIRLAIVILGVAFAAPYHAWAIERIPAEHRYTVLCFGSALGAQLIGAPAPVISLWLYQQTGWVFAPGFYLIVIGTAAVFAMTYVKSKQAARSRLT